VTVFLIFMDPTQVNTLRGVTLLCTKH